MDTKINTLLDNYTNMKTGKPISEATRKNYKYYYTSLKKIDDDFFNRLLDLQDNKNEFNALLRKVRDQVFIDNPRKKMDISRAIKYIIFIQQVISRIPELKEKLTDYGNKRLEQYKKELIKSSVDYTDDKVDFELLKIKWNDYLTKVKELTDDNDVGLNDKILFNLYRYYPIRDNYGKVRLTDKDIDDDENFYNITTKIFHLNHYKTKESYGKKKFKIPDFIADMIKKRYDEGNLYMISKGKTTLYGGKDGLLKQYIQRQSKKYFGITFGINDIRRAVINSYKDKSIKSQRELAERMLNSLSAQQQVYTRKEII